MFRPSSPYGYHRTFGCALLLALTVGISCASPPVLAARKRVPAVEAPMRMPDSLADKAHFRQPNGDEIRQFHAEFLSRGWKQHVIAAVPTVYTQQGTELVGGEQRFATLFGDVDGDGHPEWVVGFYLNTDAHAKAPAPPAELTVAASPTMDAVSVQDDRARVAIFARDASGRWRIKWVSAGLGYEFRPPKYNLWEVAKGLDQPENLRPCFSLVDIDNDRCLEIVYNCWSQAETVGGLPGILRYDGTRWVSVAPQADRFSLQDVNHDGHLQVITASPYVGFGSGDDDVPRVWRWNGRQYQEASSDYPGYYRALAGRYESFIHRMQARGEDFKKAAWERALQKAASLAG